MPGGTMPSPKKCFFGCEGKLFNFFGFPKDPSTRQEWVDTLIPGQQQKTLWVCQRHFLPDCFTNLGQCKVGLAAKLVLIDGSVPTILGRVEESEAQSTSQQTLTGETRRDTGCQTDPPSTLSSATQTVCNVRSVGTKMLFPSSKSVATQLSLTTLKQHVRSKGSQATVSCQNAGTETVVQEKGLELSSNPVKALASSLGVRAAKRARLELLEESERQDSVVSEPHDSTSIYF
ncbi:unnamed protein product [Arctogadus glacialis]